MSRMVKIICLSSHQEDYAERVGIILTSNQHFYTLDLNYNLSIQKRIYKAKRENYFYIMIIGFPEEQNETVKLNANGIDEVVSIEKLTEVLV